MGTAVQTTLAFIIAAGSIVTVGQTAGQSYPTKPIRLIVPQASGSASDAAARIIAAEVTARLKQQTIVDNRPGGALRVGA